MTAPARYRPAQIWLHWIVAVLVLAQFALSDPIAEAWRALRAGREIGFDPAVAVHVFGGIAIFLLVLWRLLLRWRHGAPELPYGTGTALRIAGAAMHWTLYALLLAVPLTGAAAWFGGSEGAASAHGLLRAVLLLLIGVHVAAALWHHFLLRDGLLRRMM